MKKIIIIAEAGVNHNGDLTRAKRMIEKAATSGADYVKFQTFKTELGIVNNAPKAPYQLDTTSKSQSQFEMIKALELNEDQHKQLIEHCHIHNIKFLSTPFDFWSIDFLVQQKINLWKLPSGEITNLPYLRKIGSFGQEIILSTGMCTLDEVATTLVVLEQAGTPRKQISLLHCNTEYPTPMEDVNLRAMETLRTTFSDLKGVGYSDHTLGIEVPIAAVARGATIIEKHFTLDRTLPGPDHRASLEPAELTAMVKAIRNIEIALGSTKKEPTTSELKNRPIARKSIVAAKQILKGELFTEENLTVKRPGTGVSPMRWDDFIGQPATRNYQEDELIDA